MVTRLYDFTANTTITSGEVDAELNQIINELNSNVILTTGAQTKAGVLTLSSSPVISTITNTGTLTLPTDTDTLVGKATTDTLTNKRTQKRVYETTSLATLTPEISTYDIFNLTAQAEAINIANHSTSTPVESEMFKVDILPDATPRAITYGTNYVAKHGVALPSVTVASKRLTMIFIWISATSKYSITWAGQEA
jgi:hypothetical protein